MKYAMVLLNKVIGVLDEKTYWPPDQHGNKVSTVLCNDETEIGMIYNPETDEFTETREYVAETEPEPTQFDRIETMLQQQDINTTEAAINTEYLVCLADLGI